jgi:uncharacterized protein YdeI (BOF family)
VSQDWKTEAIQGEAMKHIAIAFITFCFLNHALAAQEINLGSLPDSHVAKIKAKVLKRRQCPGSQIRIQLRSGTELKGRITQTRDDSFVLVDKTGAIHDIAYSSIIKVKHDGVLSTVLVGVATVGLGVAIAEGFY